MPITLSNKERMLLEDEKSHESMCIQKYTNYANQTKDSQLKQLFQNNASVEQDHLNSINCILNGEVPNLNSNQGTSKMNTASIASSPNMSPVGMCEVRDEDMCKDMLMAEKYISGVYNASIFEFRDTNVRNVLNHIQKEEQQHGEAIYKYMENKGMYKVQ